MIFAPAMRRDSHSPAAGLLQLVGLLGAPIQDPKEAQEDKGGPGMMNPFQKCFTILFPLISPRFSFFYANFLHRKQVANFFFNLS